MSKQNAILEIGGMSCEHCVKTIRGALEDTPGVDVVGVEIGSAAIILDDSLTDLDAITVAIDETGFEVVRTTIE